jgi:hypothetical protein
MYRGGVGLIKTNGTHILFDDRMNAAIDAVSRRDRKKP